MLKMKHLKKFIVKKYGLSGEEFLVEVIYKDEIIPEEYSVIDVAYLHNYRKVWSYNSSTSITYVIKIKLVAQQVLG